MMYNNVEYAYKHRLRFNIFISYENSKWFFTIKANMKPLQAWKVNEKPLSLNIDFYPSKELDITE